MELAADAAVRRRLSEEHGLPASDDGPLIGRRVVGIGTHADADWWVQDYFPACGTVVSCNWPGPSFNVRPEPFISAEPTIRVDVNEIFVWLSEGEIARAHDAVPTLEAFNRYCVDAPASRADFCFQASHKALGGYTAAVGPPWFPQWNYPPSLGHPGAKPLKQCEGCPACLFGLAAALLHPAQRTHPKVVAWLALPDRFRNAMPLPPAESKPLRFAVGTPVMCALPLNNGRPCWTWYAGTVVKQHYGWEADDREVEGWPAGCWVAYQVRLRASGHLVYVPEDADQYARSPMWFEVLGVPMWVARIGMGACVMSLMGACVMVLIAAVGGLFTSPAA